MQTFTRVHAKQNGTQAAEHASVLPSFSNLLLESTSPMVKLDHCQEVSLNPSSFVVSIAYCGSIRDKTNFHFWNVNPEASLSIAMDPQEGAAHDDVQLTVEEEDMDDVSARRGGRQKLTVRTPFSLIDPGVTEFDPEDEDTFTYDVLRNELREQIGILRAIASQSDGTDLGEEDHFPDEDVIEEALHDMADFVTDIRQTVDNMLLLIAFRIFFHNPSYRDDVKPAGSSVDVDDELMARWKHGKVGRGKAQNRLHPKSQVIDRVNFGRSMGTMADSMKEEVSSRIADLLELFTTLERMHDSSGELGQTSKELADELLLLDGDFFDLNFYATHLDEPVPLLSDDERQEFEQLDLMCAEFESLRFRKMTGSATPTEIERIEQLSSLLSSQKEQLEAMRLESILKQISLNENLQTRAAYRVDKAKNSKKNKKRGIDAESSGMYELQRIMDADRKKAAFRSKKYVAYRVIKARRRQLTFELTDANAEIVRAQAEEATETEKKWRALKTDLETRIKQMVVPQRNARVSSSAPRYRLEGRIKGGWLKRVPQKRAKPLGNTSSLDRMSDLTSSDVQEIRRVAGLLKLLLSNRGDDDAKSVLVDIVQVLVQLTGLPFGAVSRTNLSPESRMEQNTFALIASDWGGRQV